MAQVEAQVLVQVQTTAKKNKVNDNSRCGCRGRKAEGRVRGMSIISHIKFLRMKF